MISNYFLFLFWKTHAEFGYCQQMKIMKTSFENRTMLKKLGLFVSVKSIHVGLLRFLKYVGTLIKLFKPFKLQKLFMEVSSVETLKSPTKRKNLRNQGGLKWTFYVGYMIRLRTISFF